MKTPQEIPRKDKEVLLLRADDIECLNFRFSAESLTKGESLLHLFILTCETLGCEDLVCDHGCEFEMKATNHKLSKEKSEQISENDMPGMR